MYKNRTKNREPRTQNPMPQIDSRLALRAPVRGSWFGLRRVALIAILSALILLVQVYQATLAMDQRELFVLRWSAVPMEIAEQQDLEPTVPFPIAGTLISALFLH